MISKRKIGPEHVEGAVGEIGNLQDPVDQRQAQSHHGINGAQHDTVHDGLQQDTQGKSPMERPETVAVNSVQPAIDRHCH